MVTCDQLPELPRGTRTVDVDLPGVGTLRKVPVARPTTPPKGAGPRAGRDRTVDLLGGDPPRGWPTADWPTDVPDPAQLAEYNGVVDRGHHPGSR